MLKALAKSVKGHPYLSTQVNLSAEPFHILTQMTACWMAIYLGVAGESFIWVGPFDENIPYSVQSIRVPTHLGNQSLFRKPKQSMRVVCKTTRRNVATRGGDDDEDGVVDNRRKWWDDDKVASNGYVPKVTGIRIKLKTRW
jgi:hypothetical protein